MSALDGHIPEQANRLRVCYDKWREAKRSETNVSERILGTFAVGGQKTDVKRDKLHGRAHLVIPTVMLSEGVFQCANCERPGLYTSEEYGKILGAWNGRPICFGHPRRSDRFISAAEDPEAWNDWAIGTLLNVALNDQAQLVGEAWIDIDRLDDRDDDTRKSFEEIEAGKASLDVSQAAWYREVPRAGVHAGQEYEVVYCDWVPDHLAILPPGIAGMCSWQDGCGAPRSAEAPGLKFSVGMLALEHACCDACEQGHACECANDKTEEEGEAEPLAARVIRHVLDAQERMGDRTRRIALETALSEKLGGYVEIVEVYDGEVVFSHNYGRMERRSYKFRGEKVTIGEEGEHVRPVLTFVPVQTGQRQEDGQAMTTKPEDTATTPTPEQAEQARELKQVRDQLDEVRTQLKARDDEIARLKAEQPQTAQQYVQNAPETVQDRDVLQEGLAIAQADKAANIQRILKAQGNAYQQAELEAMPMASIKKIAALVPQPKPPQNPAAPLPQQPQVPPSAFQGLRAPAEAQPHFSEADDGRGSFAALPPARLVPQRKEVA